MAKNYTAYEAIQIILEGKSKDDMAEVGSRFPLFARAIAMGNVADMFKGLDKVSARMVETGMKGGEEEVEETEDVAEEKPVKVAKTSEKSVKKAEVEEEDEAEGTEYDNMTNTELYKLCCERGVSSKVKTRKKPDLIAVLVALDNGEIEPAKSGKKEKAEEKPVKVAKKPEPKEEEAEDDDWDDDEEETDPYAGKSAKELYTLCKTRGIKVAPKKSAEEYAEALKKADAEPDEDDEDDWEI